jgi:hypothetical protein
MAAVTAIMPGSTGAAGTAFESRATRAPAVWTTIATAIRTATTAVWPATAAAITSSTLWALETRAGIAADTGRITREVFARSSGAADARGARFAGKQDDVVLDDGWSGSDFSCVRFDYSCVGVLDVLVLRVFRVFVRDMLRIT